MGTIKIIRGVFDTKLELEHTSVVAGFPSPADDYPVFKIDDPDNFKVWGTVVHLIRTFESL